MHPTRHVRTVFLSSGRCLVSCSRAAAQSNCVQSAERGAPVRDHQHKSRGHTSESTKHANTGIVQANLCARGSVEFDRMSPCSLQQCHLRSRAPRPSHLRGPYSTTHGLATTANKTCGILPVCGLRTSWRCDRGNQHIQPRATLDKPCEPYTAWSAADRVQAAVDGCRKTAAGATKLRRAAPWPQDAAACAALSGFSARPIWKEPGS